MFTRVLLLLCALGSGCAPLAGSTDDLPLRSATNRSWLQLPVNGDVSLRVLSPTLIEVTLISAAPRDFSAKRALSAIEVYANGERVKVANTGWKRRPVYAPLGKRDLRVSTQLYFQLAAPLGTRDGQSDDRDVTVELRDPQDTLRLSGRRLAASNNPRRYSPAIHVNQEGYVPSLPKLAMVGYFIGDLGEMPIPFDRGFALIDARSGERVFEGKLTPRPDVGYKISPLPYQQVYAADFSAFSTPGEYELQVPGLGVSLPFLIDEGIAMGFARTYALGLYHQRCGTTNALPFTRFVHDACHIAPAQVPSPQSDPQFAFTWGRIAGYANTIDSDNPPQSAPALTSESKQLYPFVRKGTVDVAGGHHDAGDYSKYTTNSAELVHYLMFAVDSIPGVKEMDNLGIPESGDGIPDLMQEAKWEADYLAKLQDSDGGFYFLVYPKTREYESGVLPDHGDAQVVWPKNTAVTAAAVAALAQCASSPTFRKFYPQDAARYLKQAQLGWKFLTDAFAKYGKDGAYQKITFYGDHFTHNDEYVWAACEMYLATGDERYHEALMRSLPNPADPATFRWGWWKMSECWGNAMRSYAFAARSGRVPQSKLDARYLKLCEGQVLSAADDALSWSKKNAYATPFPIATKVNRSGGWYFSLDQVSDIAVAYQLDPQPAFLEALVGAMNYEAGTNPVNVAYLTGIGVKRQREVVSQYALSDRRVLPPTGIPLGNIQASFDRMPQYGAELTELTYPLDSENLYPVYDRWADSFNVSTEFITVNQARAFLVSALLAHKTPAAQKPWKHGNAHIVVPATAARLTVPLTFRLDVDEDDLDHARIVWEARDQDPAYGPTYTITPRNNGQQWVEAEVEWPDGRRAFAAANFGTNSPQVAWVDEDLPAGAFPQTGGGDEWQWVSANPTPKFGRLAHQSTLSDGLHEHWFTNATSTLTVSKGDTLFAWVYLDPEHPPREIMVMWNDGGSWEHRVYWGANLITYGENGGPGRRHMGSLPPTGKWVKLTVPAAEANLEGKTVNGMGFSQVDGRATWDAAGLESGSKK